MHMVFYRVLIIVSLMTFAAFILSLEYAALKPDVNYLIAAVWILFTPQLFVLTIGLAMVASGGLAFGHLNNSYLDTIKESGKTTIGYKMLPYMVLFGWAAGFALFLYGAIL